MAARLYLDWNATTPLRREAREAMIAAMDVVGNPSSVHAEGRAAKALLEEARADLASALGADASDIAFTSGATEGAALAAAAMSAMAGVAALDCAPVEHEALLAWGDPVLGVDPQGGVRVTDPARSMLQLANSETGVIQKLPEGLALSDLTQGFGKLPFAFDWSGVQMGVLSAHKLGGPKGVGAVVLRRGLELPAQLKGGGQEMGRRAGTENLIGIAGLAAAAKAAQSDLAAGVWEEVAEIRNILEQALSSDAEGTISVGKDASRLPNTLCLIAPGWKGETQVMAMDLAGFAVSAGSACSSGKVRASKVLEAMGYGPDEAAHAIRISIGPGISKEDVLRFADAWSRAWNRYRARAV